MALFLKYRPQTFADLVGQDVVRKTLQNALKAEKPSHAYLFAGSRGTGKTSTARIFAKGLNCLQLSDGDPCGTCEFCTGTAEGSLVDLVEIDAASNRGIDEIRDLREKIQFAPSHAKRKVYIIDEVHMLTKEAFNALLKTLEEPPDHAFFCLATTEMHKIPETILSRCQAFLFQRFTLDQLIDRLNFIAKEEKFIVEQAALALIARKAEGGLRDAISLLEQVAAETENNLTQANVQASLGISSQELLQNLYTAIVAKNTQEGLDILRNIAKEGRDFRAFGHDFLGFLREKMFQSLETPELPLILKTIEEIEKALGRLKTSPIVELPLEIAVINLTHLPPDSGGQVVGNAKGQVSREAIPAGDKKSTKEEIATKPSNPSSLDKGGNSTLEESKNSSKSTEPSVDEQFNAIVQPAQSASEGVLEQQNDILEITKEEKTEAPEVEPAPVPEPALTTADDGFVFEEADSAGDAIVPKSAKPVVATASVSSGELTNISEHLEAIATNAGIAVFAKKSFLTVIPEVGENTIVFYTDSEFHREQLIKPEVLGALQTAIREFFNIDTLVISFQKKHTTGPAPTGASLNSKAEDTASVDDFLAF